MEREDLRKFLAEKVMGWNVDLEIREMNKPTPEGWERGIFIWDPTTDHNAFVELISNLSRKLPAQFKKYDLEERQLNTSRPNLDSPPEELAKFLLPRCELIARIIEKAPDETE